MSHEHDSERIALDHEFGAELHERNAARLERHGAFRQAARERRDAASDLRAGLDGC